MDASSMTVALGNPDWQDLLRTEDADLLPAYCKPGLHFALPKAARLGAREDGRPAFFLEFFSDRNDPDVGSSLYAMLELGLETRLDLAQAHAVLSRERGAGALLPLTFTTGTWCHLELGDTHASLPFAWESAGRATLNARLPLATARLMYAAMASGSTTIVRAAIECEVAAVLPRHAVKVGFDARALLDALAPLDPAGQGIPFEALVASLDQPASSLLQIDGSASKPFGLALAGRLRQAFGRFAPCVRVGDGPRIHLDPPAAGDARVLWDLDTPLMCAVPVFLRCDPFDILKGDNARDRLTAFTSVPRLPDELRTRRVTVASGLPDSFLDCEEISVDLSVDARYAASGTATGQAVTLYPAASRSATVTLAYATINGPKPYRAKVTVVGQDDVVEGPEFDADDDYLFIDSSRLPLQAVTLRATDALLAQAVLSLSLEGAAGETIAAARLDAARPAVTFLTRTELAAATMRIVAHSPADPDAEILLTLPCRSTELAPASFPGYGPRSVAVAVSFHDGTTEAKLAVQAESGDADPVVLVFSPDAPQGSWSYVATDIFKTRYRFRAHDDENGDAAPPWSPYLSPDQVLAVGAYRDGVRQET